MVAWGREKRAWCSLDVRFASDQGVCWWWWGLRGTGNMGRRVLLGLLE